MSDSASHLQTVLVVDDTADTADLIALLLEDHGYSATAAYDGVLGLSMAQERHPDILILDLGMPGMNGLEVCRRIRSEPWGAGVRIIMMSGWTRLADRERAMAVGCDAFVMKPASLSEVLEAIGWNVPTHPMPGVLLRPAAERDLLSPSGLHF